jgi:integrative and conjugative element protein (TIGR02256 family)
MMETRECYRFQTEDHAFGLEVQAAQMKTIVTQCRQTPHTETGGIIVGFYTEDLHWAIVTDVSSPPQDSRRFRFAFHRGVIGLQEWLRDLWSERKQYYLGEWHFHPMGSPMPSGIDDRQMSSFATKRDLHCPEPVLLVIGGNPSAEWLARAYVYEQGISRREMQLRDDLAAAPNRTEGTVRGNGAPANSICESVNWESRDGTR